MTKATPQQKKLMLDLLRAIAQLPAPNCVRPNCPTDTCAKCIALDELERGE